MNPTIRLYVPITRSDSKERIVEGYAYVNAECGDRYNLKRSAMENATSDYMQWGAVREMHQPLAAGTALGAEWDEAGVRLTAKIVDDVAWKKVEAGVYKGFSVGVNPVECVGRDVERCVWIETSLVDRPQDPDSVFTVVRAEGIEPDDEEVAEVIVLQRVEEPIVERDQVGVAVSQIDDDTTVVSVAVTDTDDTPSDPASIPTFSTVQASQMAEAKQSDIYDALSILSTCIVNALNTAAPSDWQSLISTNIDQFKAYVTSTLGGDAARAAAIGETLAARMLELRSYSAPVPVAIPGTPETAETAAPAEEPSEDDGQETEEKDEEAIRAAWAAEPAGETQIQFLRSKGVAEDKLVGITKGDAAILVGALTAAPAEQPAHPVQERASEVPVVVEPVVEEGAVIERGAAIERLEITRVTDLVRSEVARVEGAFTTEITRLSGALESANKELGEMKELLERVANMPAVERPAVFTQGFQGIERSFGTVPSVTKTEAQELALRLKELEQTLPAEWDPAKRHQGVEEMSRIKMRLMGLGRAA